jgi:hypothetical protein
MEQRSDIHQREGGKSRERFVGEAAGKVQETSHRPRSTIVPGALDEPFAEPEVFDGHALAGTPIEGKTFGRNSSSPSSSKSTSGRSTSGWSTTIASSADLEDADLEDADLEDADLEDAADSGPPTQPRISALPLPLTEESQSRSQARYEPVPVHSHVKEKFYLRLELRKDCLADLWVRDLTPHNVLAWSDGMESWVPLLTVPELREAIRTAQDRKTRDLLSNSQPPPALVVPSSEDRIPLPPPRRAGSIVSAAPARAGKFWHMPHPRPAGGSSTIPAPPLSPQSSRPPPRLDGRPRTPSVLPAMLESADDSSVTAIRASVPPPAGVPKRSSLLPPALGSQRPSIPPPARAPQPTSVPPPARASQRSKSGEPPAKPLSSVPLPVRTGSARAPSTSAPASESVSLRGQSVPDFPRPARVPSFVEPVVTPQKNQTPAAKAGNAETLMPRAVSVKPVAAWRLPRVGLVNLERAVWLAAGISVATAASFILRSAPEGTASANVSSASQPPTASGNDGTILTSAQASGANRSSTGKDARAAAAGDSIQDAAKVEDLPLVGTRGALKGTGHSAVASLTSTSNSTQDARGVRAEALTLAASPARPSTNSNSSTTKSSSQAAASEGAFDPAQARRVLASAAGRARSCAEGALSGAVQVTFAPSGFVQGASLLNLDGEGVRSGCVLRAFQEARVSPFVGASVAVKKSFAFP